MAVCEVCGNDYNNSFEINIAGEYHTFDSFECAINMLAPECHHCGCKVIGHGVEKDGNMFCCTHCADHSGMMSTKGLK